jgi:tRNA(Ile)-lysidine synthase
VERAVNVSSVAAEKGVSIEEAGRIVRYAFFEEIREFVGAQAVATAHHLDDEIETFFLRIFRGSSPKGLRGIRPVRGHIIRPLLCMTRKQIMAFLEREQIPYRLDPTNLEDNTDRNFVRNRLIPLVGERFPDFAKPLKRSMDLIEREEGLLQELTSELYSQAVSRIDHGLVFDLQELRSAPDALVARVIVLALYEISGVETRWQRSHVDAILDMIHSENPSAEIHLPGDLIIHREYERLKLSRGAQEDLEDYAIDVVEPGKVHVPGAGVTFNFRILPKRALTATDLATTRRVWFDADEIGFPLTVRNPLPGDRFQPWGMDGTRKLKKVLIDAKVPLRERKSFPLVVKGDEILWVPRIRRGMAAPVIPDTERVLEVSIAE